MERESVLYLVRIAATTGTVMLQKGHLGPITGPASSVLPPLTGKWLSSVLGRGSSSPIGRYWGLSISIQKPCGRPSPSPKEKLHSSPSTARCPLSIICRGGGGG